MSGMKRLCMRFSILNLFSFTGLLCYFILRFGIMCAETGTSKALYPVGMKMVEFVDPENTDRHIAFMLFYPATIQKQMPPFQMTFFTHLHLYKDATPLPDNVKCPLVIFSHGYGSNGTYYAWFAEFLAARGYIVAAIYHYRANTYDSTAMYLANKLWQRPVDISLIISFLLKDPFWGPRIDPNRIGVAGHSQGGFTALWIGGAKVNPEKFLNFQRIWINRQVIPEYLRRALPLDAKPALHVHDKRVKAVFAMAPGDIKVFGMDEEGLQQLKIPTYIIVGEKDTQTPPKENAEFAAKYIPNAQLELIPGADHEIFVNACDQEGKNVFPGACVDAPGINRVKIHEAIGQAALKFFNTNMPPTVKNEQTSSQ